MDIKILDSHLREYLKTPAKPKNIAKALSLTSASVEKMEERGKDTLYHIEVTTNRPDMASVVGIARETAAALLQFDFDAEFLNVIASKAKQSSTLPMRLSPKGNRNDITIINNDKLVKRVCGVILEVTQKDSPQYIKERLEAAGIRSLNNVIDITNYVMLEIGHPTHAFDYDRLTTKKLLIREAKKGEKIVTLDKKEHILLGGDIIADNGKGEIVDLLGVMGTLNSVITNNTKRILFFLDNNDSQRIRRTSMSLGIRTDAASLNEKDVDPELAMTALLRGIELYREVADAKIVSEIIDIYPHPWKPKTITVREEKMKRVIGIDIDLKQAETMLIPLGFKTKQKINTLEVTIPSWRDKDMQIEEDVIEEIARMYGYHTIPVALPPNDISQIYHLVSPFYFESKTKSALKYWGMTEVYTYSMVSETMLEVAPDQAVTLKNPLDADHVYMRTTLIPSLLQVAQEHTERAAIQIFEIANVYRKKTTGLPDEIRTLAMLLKGKQGNFYHAKGIVEQLVTDLGIENLQFTDLSKGGLGADVLLDTTKVGEIEILEENLVVVELNFDIVTTHATLTKSYTPIAKYPPVIEDMAFVLDEKVRTGNVMSEIKKQSTLIATVTLLDQYQDTRTFHIIYQDREKNLTGKDIEPIRKSIVETVEKKFKGKLK